ncbi:response regulator transcription factor [Paucihalobacter ruber]|uniref:Response regulator transcription factor n=1 Tax=Paucihalobacter ruber TaxID=2567861 RepID=A0A506PHH4_9FLAO|nr:LytTR family DNA-binding domain-containing protein [Paucihalobacter ruber]TPV33283.1 response regulator transcription factor [Paucihalobacter ruber]
MKVVIIEDEGAAAENLKLMLSEIDTSIIVDKVIDTVAGAITYFSEINDIELAFFDIHLADGISFEIFNQQQINIPIIFTTAYDEFAIKAFKVNSIDYLLKPIDEEELSEAIHKFKKDKKIQKIDEQFQQVLQIIQSEKKTYKTTYLFQKRDTLVPVKVEDIAYFIIEVGIVKAISFNNKEYIIDKKLEDIENELDPSQFFRANRQFIVNRKAIKHLELYFNGKLIINIEPKPSEKIVVSKAKAPQLKDWMN